MPFSVQFVKSGAGEFSLGSWFANKVANLVQIQYKCRNIDLVLRAAGKCNQLATQRALWNQFMPKGTLKPICFINTCAVMCTGQTP